MLNNIGFTDMCFVTKDFRTSKRVVFYSEFGNITE